jgi:hypothetical protein
MRAVCGWQTQVHRAAMIIPYCIPILTFLHWKGRAIIFPFYFHLYDMIPTQICTPLRDTCTHTEYLNTLVFSNRILNLAMPRGLQLFDDNIVSQTRRTDREWYWMIAISISISQF